MGWRSPAFRNRKGMVYAIDVYLTESLKVDRCSALRAVSKPANRAGGLPSVRSVSFLPGFSVIRNQMFTLPPRLRVSVPLSPPALPRNESQLQISRGIESLFVDPR